MATSQAPTLDLEWSLLAPPRAGVVIGVDEVGRGALAGPVTIGAVAVDRTCGTPPTDIRDSKALSQKRRQDACPAIRAWAIDAAVVHIPAERIDKVGITQALGEGAAQAVASISDRRALGCVLLDGRHDFITPVDPRWSVRTVIKGDATCISIAAASILAKEERDGLMRDLHVSYPVYGWDRNVGYGTAGHRSAIATHGVTTFHRRSWNLLPT
ncbi:MAG: ribonuclease HII [Actinomycetota bacterium]|nr:ribonuclease HII [Actinomycetota bacterium]